MLLPRRVVTLVAILCASGLLDPVAQNGVSAQSSSARLDPNTARAMVDSLLHQVGALRGLEPLRPVQTVVADRARIRARLEEIMHEEEVRIRARGDERLLRYLGLLPPDADLLQITKDLLEEQLAGMYDIDERQLYLADWIPTELQSAVVTHEIAHALQDQHFSLRVRKKLGFDTPDAEAAWQALIEGDATAVMLESSLRPLGQSFAALADSAGMEPWSDILDKIGSAGGNMSAGKLLEAPRVVREALMFPYERGLAFVGAVYAAGGWKRVDEAYVHPPASTEQIMHPSRFLTTLDAPIRVELPDVRGLLGNDYSPAVKTTLGEIDLRMYLGEYVDTEIADIASEGWGGASAVLYSGAKGSPEVLVLFTTWDSEDDATEFFGAILGLMERRYPKQTGVASMSAENLVAWNVDEEARWQNVVSQNGRDVFCIEHVPAASALRVVQKVQQQVRLHDPTPDVRTERREHLPWNIVLVESTPADSYAPLQVQLPPGWTQEADTTRSDLLMLARRADARLEVGVDRAATDRLGAGGYAHVLAERIQKRGNNVYVQTDVVYPRPDTVPLYQLIFAQTEGERQVVYYIGVVELTPGFGYIQLTEPQEGETPAIDKDFYSILDTLRVAGAAGAPDHSH